jgi:hypothetical protein
MLRVRAMLAPKGAALRCRDERHHSAVVTAQQHRARVVSTRQRSDTPGGNTRSDALDCAPRLSVTPRRRRGRSVDRPPRLRSRRPRAAHGQARPARSNPTRGWPSVDARRDHLRSRALRAPGVPRHGRRLKHPRPAGVPEGRVSAGLILRQPIRDAVCDHAPAICCGAKRRAGALNRHGCARCERAARVPDRHLWATKTSVA